MEVFTKEQVLKSSKYKHVHDVLSALLIKSKSYTSKEIDTILKKFMKGGR